ncbi:MAG: hypothetical protein A3F16_02330 [Deltaproteobacteria bacterium RIFCSPHIGHO2_12_FULL_43_9]|nr:MAG: hypothetical protein A3F16_02330 [Deltaproteobacteria bacterium RIFCSPHIGHO2_12_FULL_43_9]
MQEITYQKDPLLTALLSLFCPGAGQIYNGEPGKGVLFLSTFWIFGIPWIWSIIDAFYVSVKINDGKLPNLGNATHVFLFVLIPLLTVAIFWMMILLGVVSVLKV